MFVCDLCIVYSSSLVSFGCFASCFKFQILVSYILQKTNFHNFKLFNCATSNILKTHHVVVVAGGGDLFEDGGDAKEEDVEEDVEEVAEGEAEHQLVEVLLDQLPRKPNDSRRVANNSKHPDNKLKRGVDDSHN